MILGVDPALPGSEETVFIVSNDGIFKFFKKEDARNEYIASLKSMNAEEYRRLWLCEWLPENDC